MTRSAKTASCVLFIPWEETCFSSWNFLLWFLLLCATFLLFNLLIHIHYTFILLLRLVFPFFSLLMHSREKGAGCCIAHGDELFFTTDTLFFFFALHIRLGDSARFFDLVPVMLANII